MILDPKPSTDDTGRGIASVTEVEPTSLGKRVRILAPGAASSAVRLGIITAARDCEEWGGDWPTDRGCENLLQVRVAEQVHRLIKDHGLGYITLEEPLATVVDGGTRKRGRRFADMTAQQRADLAIWTKAPRVYALVEIKRAERDGDWRSDLTKLSRLMATYGRAHGCHLRYCVFGAFISSHSPEMVEVRGERLTEMARQIAERYGLFARTRLDEARHSGPRHWGDDWTCGAASVLITPSPTWRA